MSRFGRGRLIWMTAALLGIVLFPAGDSARAQGTATETVDFSIQVDPVFVVNSTSDQGGNLEFSVRPGEAVSRTARVSIRSNTGRPYRILQRLEQPLQEPVSFAATDGSRGGRSEVKTPQPLTTDPCVVFVSNPQGESDDFTIDYSVSSKQLIPAGSYRARILIEEEFR